MNIINMYISRNICICSLGLLILVGCSHQKPMLTVTQYSFNYKDQPFRIRSITSTEKSKSMNELIGDSVMAADYDQDRIIDRILYGKFSLDETQQIYNHGLNSVSEHNLLVVRNPTIDHYVARDDKQQYEIRTFRPTDGKIFNQFKITDARPVIPVISIFLDQEADGNLDKTIQGSMPIADAQRQYTKAIESGLQNGQLVKLNGTIQVATKQ
ncbi:hypothetical protein JW960_06760 [candidate division KSB1 bacterium]|nr:hypothetical protein [candidate division KSB1 bacterium]